MAMKRIAAMLLTSVLLLSCVGCAQDGRKEPGAEKADASITNNTPPSHDTSVFHRLDACMPILHPQSTAQKLTTKLPITVK